MHQRQYIIVINKVLSFFLPSFFWHRCRCGEQIQTKFEGKRSVTENSLLQELISVANNEIISDGLGDVCDVCRRCQKAGVFSVHHDLLTDTH